MPNHATTIEWMTALADSRGMRAAVYNPIRGCKPAGDACRSCWAAEVAVRRANHPNAAIRARHEGLAYRASDGRAVFNGTWRFIADQLDVPLRTRKPTAYFVGSETDLFGEDVPDDWLDRVFAVMALCPQHLFLVLTKRPERMREYIGQFFMSDDGRYVRSSTRLNDDPRDADKFFLLRGWGWWI